MKEQKIVGVGEFILENDPCVDQFKPDYRYAGMVNTNVFSLSVHQIGSPYGQNCMTEQAYNLFFPKNIKSIILNPNNRPSGRTEIEIVEVKPEHIIFKYFVD